jgi:protein-L-isoaspartate(D-aspartate) O-methyltransferase
MNTIPRQLERFDFANRRIEMVERQIAHRGVRSELVLSAMKAVPREPFLPEELWEFAYEDAPLPIAEGQTISQPYIVAMMTEALGLQGGEKVLEIGTGSGYAAAILSQIAANVYTVERIEELAKNSAATLTELGYKNVQVLHGDGTLGWPEHAPYDAIVVAAGGPEVPESLKAQLKIGGGSRSQPAGVGARCPRIRAWIQDRGACRCPVRPSGRGGRVGTARTSQP